MTGFVYKLEQVDVARLISKVLTHKLENGPFQQERIVDGLEPHALDAMPRLFPVTYCNLVHEIIRDQEVGVQLHAGCHENRKVVIMNRTDEYDCPSENCGLFVFRIIQLSSSKGFCRLDHKEASLVFATKGVIVETLCSDVSRCAREGYEMGYTHARNSLLRPVA